MSVWRLDDGRTKVCHMDLIYSYLCLTLVIPLSYHIQL